MSEQSQSQVELSDSVPGIDLDNITQADVDRAAGNSLLAKLRRAAYYMPDGTKAQKVSVIGKSLGDAQLLEIWARLRQAKQDGRSCYDALAFKIQNEWGLLKELTKWHITRAIMFYEQRIFGLLGVAESVPELAEWTRSKAKAIKQIIEKVDGLDELAKAIKQHQKRIDMIVEKEMKLQVPMPNTHKEYKALRDMVETFLKYQIELGYHKRQPIQLDIGIKESFESQKKQIDQTVGKDAMQQAAERFIDMLKNDRGKFEIVEDITPD